jgi:WD40 repeat protein
VKHGLITALSLSLLTAAAKTEPPKAMEISQPKPILTLRGHPDAVCFVQFAPDGKRLVTTADKTAALWDITKGKTMLTLRGHKEDIVSLCFDPDGSRLATGDRRGEVRLWETRAGRPLLILRRARAIVDAVTFNPQGDCLAAAYFDLDAQDGRGAGLVQLRDARTGKRKATFLSPWGRVRALSCSPCGRWLAVGAMEGMVAIWDVRGGTTVRTLRGHRGPVRAVQFSEDGRRLATGGDDGKVTVWDFAAGQRASVLQGPDGAIFAVAWGGAGRQLRSAHLPEHAEEGFAVVRAWHLPASQGRVILRVSKEELLDNLAFSLDGRLLATAYEDGTVKIWSVEKLLGQARPSR